MIIMSLHIKNINKIKINILLIESRRENNTIKLEISNNELFRTIS